MLPSVSTHYAHSSLSMLTGFATGPECPLRAQIDPPVCLSGRSAAESRVEQVSLRAHQGRPSPCHCLEPPEVEEHGYRLDSETWLPVHNEAEPVRGVAATDRSALRLQRSPRRRGEGPLCSVRCHRRVGSRSAVLLTTLAVLLLACGCRGERHDWTLSVMNDRGSAIVVQLTVNGGTDSYLVPAPTGGVVVAVLDHPFTGSIVILNADSCAKLGPLEEVPTVGDAWIFARFDGGFDVLRHDLGGDASKDVVTAERTDLCGNDEASGMPSMSPDAGSPGPTSGLARLGRGAHERPGLRRQPPVGMARLAARPCGPPPLRRGKPVSAWA